MAVLNTTNLTLTDWTKRVGPDGNIPEIANTLAQTNEILTDAVYREANDATTHTEVIATGLPDIYFRSLNQGIPSSKASTAQVVEGMSIMEARSEVDKDLAMLNGNTAAFRRSESRLFLEAMNQKQAQTLIYGNAGTDPKSYTGLAVRYSSTSAGNGTNVLLSEASPTAGACTSIFLVVWGDQTVFCPFPKGSTAGLQQRDLGEQTVYTTDGSVANRMQALVEWFQWKQGLVVKDWRYVVRVANIDTTDFATLAGPQVPTSFTHIIHQMLIAIAKIPSMSMGRPAFYVNRSVFSCLMRLALEKSTSVLSLQSAMTQFGTPTSMLSFMGVPIRRCDQILNTESAIS